MSYAEFIKRKKGPKDNPQLNIVLRAPFDEEFTSHLKNVLRHGEQRIWDEDWNVWRISSEALECAIEVAKSHFGSVYLVEGGRSVEMKTGNTFQQTEMFK